ncbi:MAG: TRAP transporter TatT component family protein [Gammaproteobacteria bacterium]|nr:TRAP transporter TatT component family protein [Gammaproteobacteria bacterium]MBU1600942.1 TRAP transporter TatT component family protein [Gammaproteobacteria bacterium]MBU2434301.1 TRAP transporter TatT component family protein [Gammaproteobacteria bacterium]MBU2450705.1 TRAP transporter TatT component family protein [Gammaproteobacteria bacterium]
MPLPRRSTFLALVALLASVLVTGCSPRQLVVGSIADELAAQGQASENDLDLAREASAFYLKLSESVLRSDPGHQGLAEAVAGGFTQYAYAFVAFEADRIEAKDAKAAERLRRRAAQLYRRAHKHAMAALEKETPGFALALNAPLATDQPKLTPAQVGLAYWAAASWGGWISLSKDDPDVVADLPLAVRLTQLAWQVDPAWGQGALTGLLATFEASRPGGSQAQALVWYDQAIAQGGGKSAGALVGKAEGYAQSAGDRALFESLLKQAVAIKDAPDSPQALQNEVMRRRAAWLLEQAPDLF